MIQRSKFDGIRDDVAIAYSANAYIGAGTLRTCLSNHLRCFWRPYFFDSPAAAGRPARPSWLPSHFQLQNGLRTFLVPSVSVVVKVTAKLLYEEKDGRRWTWKRSTFRKFMLTCKLLPLNLFPGQQQQVASSAYRHLINMSSKSPPRESDADSEHEFIHQVAIEVSVSCVHL